MTPASPFLFVAVIVLVIILLLLLIRGSVIHTTRPLGTRKPIFARAPLLTANECQVMTMLCETVSEPFHVCPRLRLSNFISVKGSEDLQQRINARSADFGVIDRRSGIIVMVIELDERNPDRPHRATRDDTVNRVLADLGIPVHRLRPGDRLDASHLPKPLASQTAPPPAELTPAHQGGLPHVALHR